MDTFSIDTILPLPQVGIVAIWGHQGSTPWWGSVSINVLAMEAHIRVTIAQAGDSQAVGLRDVSLSFSAPAPRNPDIIFTSCVRGLSGPLYPYIQEAVQSVMNTIPLPPENPRPE